FADQAQQPCSGKTLTELRRMADYGNSPKAALVHHSSKIGYLPHGGVDVSWNMAKLSSEKYLVLMVDDSEDDCLLIRRGVGKAERLRFIGSVSDGEELVSYLTGNDEYSDRPGFPFLDLLLLALQLPRKNRFE